MGLQKKLFFLYVVLGLYCGSILPSVLPDNAKIDAKVKVDFKKDMLNRLTLLGRYIKSNIELDLAGKDIRTPEGQKVFFQIMHGEDYPGKHDPAWKKFGKFIWRVETSLFWQN